MMMMTAVQQVLHGTGTIAIPDMDCKSPVDEGRETMLSCSNGIFQEAS